MPADRTTLALRVDVLGPLTLHVDGHQVDVPGGRRRALLALLGLEAGRAVSTERLVESLWPDEPPDNAVQALYNHLSRLRGHLGPRSDRLERHSAGYLLRLEPDELDADAARRLVRAAARPGTPPEQVAEVTRQALRLWRGPALSEFRSIPALEVESVGLDELQLQLVDDLLDARLATGDRTVSVDAAAAAAAAPLRERTALLHMRALGHEGRAADAMAAAQVFRRRLIAETGLDPSPALAQLEQQVAAGEVTPLPAAWAVQRGTALRPTRPDGPMVGRSHDREEMLRLLGLHAVVTIAGPGGVGKSRLALDLAAEPETLGEVVVADLAAVDKPERLCAAIASTLGLRTTELGPVDVAAALADRELVLVLDNCEHMAVECRALVVALRRGAPGVRILATSRSTLRVAGEYVVRLQPLPVPRDASDLDALRGHPAVRAFVAHAQRRRADYDVTADDAADLVEVLRRLDGLPLGIELAARQVAVMPLTAVRARLDRALDLATGRPGTDDDRQRTLRATIDSSYRLLEVDEQRLLRALAPFPGGVDLLTVETLAAGLHTATDPLDLLHHLVDASMLIADPATARYRMLFTLRTFLLEELAELGELAEAEARFVERCLVVAKEIEQTMFGVDEASTDRRLRAELDNLRAARDLAPACGLDEVRVGVTIAVNQVAVWRDLRELWSWSLELAADPSLADHPDRVTLLSCAAESARLVGDLDRAQTLADQALSLAGPEAEPPLVHRAHSVSGSVAHFRGDFPAARKEWLRAAEGSARASAAHVASAALASSYGGDAETARELLDRARELDAATGCPSHAAFIAYVQGEVVATEHVEDSIPLYAEAIDGAERVGASFIEGVARVALASARTRIGDIAGAAEGFAYLIDFWRRTGQTTQLWTTARNAAGLLSTAGPRRTAALLLICADSTPGAAAVGPAIARHSGRVFTPVADLATGKALAQLRADAARLGVGAVLELAVADLRELAGAATD